MVSTTPIESRIALDPRDPADRRHINEFEIVRNYESAVAELANVKTTRNQCETDELEALKTSDIKTLATIVERMTKSASYAAAAASLVRTCANRAQTQVDIIDKKHREGECSLGAGENSRALVSAAKVKASEADSLRHECESRLQHVKDKLARLQNQEPRRPVPALQPPAPSGVRGGGRL